MLFVLLLPHPICCLDCLDVSDQTGALTTPLPLAVLLRAEELLNHVVCVVVAISHLLFSSFRFIDRTGAFFPERGRTLIAAQYCRYCRQSNLPV